MIWTTETTRVDLETGEILTDYSDHVEIKQLREITTTFKDYNHATRKQIKYYRRNPQRTINFFTEWDELEK